MKGKCLSTKPTCFTTGVVYHPDSEQNRPYKIPWPCRELNQGPTAPQARTLPVCHTTLVHACLCISRSMHFYTICSGSKGVQEKILRGQKSERRHPKCAKICYFTIFMLKIVKFGLNLNIFAIIFSWGGGKWGKEFFGGQMPWPPVALHTLWNWFTSIF